MGYRRFTDPDGATWEVRDVSMNEWDLVPADPGPAPVRVPAPGYNKDPFDISSQELQRLLARHRRPEDPDTPTGRRKPSPFKD